MTSNPPIADTTMRPIAQSVGVPKATDPALMATIPQMSSRRVLPVCLLLTHGETAAVPEEQIRSTDVGCGSWPCRNAASRQSDRIDGIPNGIEPPESSGTHFDFARVRKQFYSCAVRGRERDSRREVLVWHYWHASNQSLRSTQCWTQP